VKKPVSKFAFRIQPAALQWGASPACVFGGWAAPAHVVSSVYVACEVSVGVVTSPEIGDSGAGGTGAMWGPWGDELGGSVGLCRLNQVDP
jgi:hypothetical protein